MMEYTADLPSQTSTGQAGLLHGNAAGIPAFRWYEKEKRRMMVSNRPADAAEIESRISDGNGLLANGGASIDNMFSGDATHVRMVRMGGWQTRPCLVFPADWPAPDGRLMGAPAVHRQLKRWIAAEQG